MFLLGLIYLIILVVAGIFWPNWGDFRGRLGGFATLVLFTIIWIVLFWDKMNR